MITTITLNPSVDKLYLVDHLLPESVMRVKEVLNTPGGKGLNVAKVAALTGESVRAMGFLGGHNGEYIRDMLQKFGVQPAFTRTEGETRSCINVRDHSTGRHTEFLEPGSPVSQADVSRFMGQLNEALADTAVVTLSGSAPPGVPANLYGTIIERAKAATVPVLLDTSGVQLQESVRACPTLIKPNRDEMEQLLGKPVADKEELAKAAENLQRGGIPYVVVSMGKEGALMACEEGVFLGKTPDISVVNTVGCGDSMIAGFAVGLSRGYGTQELLRYALAVSTANALTMQTGFFKTEDLEALLHRVQVIQMEEKRRI